MDVNGVAGRDSVSCINGEEKSKHQSPIKEVESQGSPLNSNQIAAECNYRDINALGDFENGQATDVSIPLLGSLLSKENDTLALKSKALVLDNGLDQAHSHVGLLLNHF